MLDGDQRPDRGVDIVRRNLRELTAQNGISQTELAIQAGLACAPLNTSTNSKSTTCHSFSSSVRSAILSGSEAFFHSSFRTTGCQFVSLSRTIRLT